MTFRFSDLVGRYRLVVSSALRQHIERAFVERVPAPERAMVRAEALHEANGAELEIRADGTFISRSHQHEFFRVALVPDDEEHEDLSFEKSPGEPVRLLLVDADTVLAVQPDKPPAEFKRVR